VWLRICAGIHPKQSERAWVDGVNRGLKFLQLFGLVQHILINAKQRAMTPDNCRELVYNLMGKKQ